MTDLKEFDIPEIDTDLSPPDQTPDDPEKEVVTSEKRPYRGFQDLSPEKLKDATTRGRNEMNRQRSMRTTAARILASHTFMEAKDLMDELIGKGHNCTNEEAMLLVQTYKAIVKGDTKAAEFMRDTSGNKPTEKLDISADVHVVRFEQKIIDMEPEEEVIEAEFEVKDEWEL